MTRPIPILRYISSVCRISCLLLSLFLSCAANAQKKTVATIDAVDSVSFFRGVAVSVDAVGPLQMVLGDYGQYEARLRFNLKDKYYPVIELGYGKADTDDPDTGIGYKTNAPYGRMGMDFNLLKNKHDVYRLLGGVRLAYTSFKYDVSGKEMTDPVWQTTVPYSATDVKGSYIWMEIVVGVDAKIWGPLRMGWGVRYRRRLSHSEGTVGNPWYVPGYGRSGNSRLGGTFDITIEI